MTPLHDPAGGRFAPPVPFLACIAVGALAAVGCGGGDSTSPAPELGSLRVAVAAPGSVPHPGDLVVTLAGVGTRSLPPGAAAVFDELDPGAYRVDLTGVAEGCSTEAGTVRRAEVVADETARVEFVVLCGDDQVLLFWTLPPCTSPVSCAGGGVADGGSELHVVRPDGSNLRRLTDDPAWHYDPVWSPDRGRIAFTRGRQGERELSLWVLDVGDGDETLLRAADGEGGVTDPTWAPDGRRIAFEEDGAIWTVETEDGTPERIASDGRQPAWSPDGSRIAFVREVAGRADLMTMNADGTGVLRITATPEHDETHPTWSPDGSRIAFRRSAPGVSDVLTIAPDGSDERLILDDLYMTDLEWAPSGSLLVGTLGLGGRLVIGSLTLDGTFVRPLWAGEFTAEDPSW